MELISVERRNSLYYGARTLLKLELRDHYLVDEATMAAWRSGDAETLAAQSAASAARVVRQVADGVSVRRVKVISEPPSEYMRMAVDYATALVEAGEDTRWLPRRLTSALLLPGNDFFVLDGELAMFNVLDGDNDRAEVQLWTERDVVERCRAAFEAAWELATPHREYRVP